MTRCIIIDDEPQSRMALKDALQENVATIKIIAEANSVASAVEAMDNFQPDLVFLDIQLGDGSGFDVLEKAAWKNSKVIFVTAYNQYAIQAFRVNAMDYLLKPINNHQLAEAVAKMGSFDANKQFAQLQKLVQQLSSNDKMIGFSTSEGYSLHYVDDIVRCESDNNYCNIFFINQERLLIAKTLKDLEAQFSGYNFQRVHHSHLINMQHVKKYLNKDGGVIVMRDGTIVPISHRKKASILTAFQNYI